MKFKSFNIITFLIFFTLCNNLSFSQNEDDRNFGKETGRYNFGYITAFIEGGLIYHSAGDGLFYINEYSNANRERLSFISSLIFSYSLSEKHFIDLGLSFVSFENNGSNLYSAANWNYNIYPITLSYKYFTKIYPSKLRTFVGVGLSYIINRVIVKVTGIPDRINSGEFNSKGYGFEFYAGLLYTINNRIILSSKIKLNYKNEYAFENENIDSGNVNLQLLLGIGYTL